jgi:X-X-X-Leu-X-X-Gly heptad repeat protein
VTGLERLVTGLERLVTGLARLVTGLARLVTGLARLVTGLARLVTGLARLVLMTVERFQVARLDQALARSAVVGVWRRTLRALGTDAKRIPMVQASALARRHSLAAQG